MTQKKKSAGRVTCNVAGKIYNSCLYRHPDGLKCAAGCLIPDKYYDESMEGINFSCVCWQYVLLPKYLKMNKELISDLQVIHDVE